MVVVTPWAVAVALNAPHHLETHRELAVELRRLMKLQRLACTTSSKALGRALNVTFFFFNLQKSDILTDK